MSEEQIKQAIRETIKKKPLTPEDRLFLTERAIEAAIKFSHSADGLAGAYETAMISSTYFFVVQSERFFREIGCHEDEEPEAKKTKEDTRKKMIADLCEEV